jgi:hypothetical protein
MAGEAAGTVDVFEELARLPEPLPLPDPAVAPPDLLAPPPPPAGAVELVDSGVALSASASTAAAGAGASPEPMLAESTTRSASDAPPIDVALRTTSDGWADWGKVPTSPPIGNELNHRVPGESLHPEASTTDTTGPEIMAPWEPPPWQPPGPDGASLPGGPPSFWEGTDDWAPATDDTTDAWTSHEWPTDLSGEPEPAVPEPEFAEPFPEAFAETFAEPETAAPSLIVETPLWVNAPDRTAAGWLPPAETTDDDTLGAAELTDAGPWTHEPDPAAVSTGFYVDWGTAETDDGPPAWQALIGPDHDAEPAPWTDAATPAWEPAASTWTEATVESPLAASTDIADVTDIDTDRTDTDSTDTGSTDTDAAEPDLLADPVPEPEPELETSLPALPPILWRADAHVVPELEPGPAIVPDPGPEAAPGVEKFAVAGTDWQLGNALPLVEVRGQGALVMRRADERWALADLTTPRDCAIEVDLDFRSGPGLGVLFRASVDAEGRMSGYSFDIDPIYDGGGYLVRQWQADREMWNPIARVSSIDPGSMYGTLTVRIVLEGDRMTAAVNGADVLTVESLAQASVERGRDAADGNQVGVQAWSSSDLVIETLRVAEH